MASGVAALAALPGEALALAAALVSSVGYVSARRGLDDVSPEALVTATTAVSVLILSPLVVLLDQPLLSSTAAGVFFVSGVLGSGLGRFMLSHAIGLVGAGVAHAVKSASPMVAAAFSVIFLGESLSPLLAVGIVVVVVGLVILTRADAADGERHAGLSTTAVIALVLVLWFGVTPVIRKYGLSVLDAPVLPALAMNFAAGLLVGLVIALARDPGQLRTFTRPGPRRFLALTGVCWTAAITMYFAALAVADAVVVVPIFNASPLFTVTLGILLLDEAQGARRRTVTGAVVTVVGVVLVTLG
ncbi:DMT family transporter [Halocalculus aciditolerans]|uniref:EamA domain-containing protein n=1 Tax=Halocalculus aciditolerans TaxID=1383812 RepID=A0A830F6D0_9EURY|nr:DMT family transporter [Halocalculus aciditolerans]GGL67397.1 hypothetical protein GCM10009039_26790 [Halocalculus aciditolerans]